MEECKRREEGEKKEENTLNIICMHTHTCARTHKSATESHQHTHEHTLAYIGDTHTGAASCMFV